MDLLELKEVLVLAVSIMTSLLRQLIKKKFIFIFE